MLCFRDQKLTPAQFAAAGEIFGPLMQHHHRDVRIGHPDVYEVKQTEIAPGKYRIAGETSTPIIRTIRCPPKATSLYTVIASQHGGDTQFVNMHNAYDDLPEAMKQRIAGLKALHVFESKFSPRKLRPLDEESAKELPPPTLHPLVRTHPENGRKFLYLNPVRIEAISGLDEKAALDLVAELMAHATQKKYEYRHKWVMGDMVIWDDRSVMHQANGDYDMKEIRHLYRIMVQDDPKHWIAEGEKSLAQAAA